MSVCPCKVRISLSDWTSQSLPFYAGNVTYHCAIEGDGREVLIEVPQFQKLLQFICRNGYEHHVAATKAPVADSIEDALTTYLGWQTYHHGKTN